MVALLQAGFNSGALTYDASTVYAIFTAGGVNLGGGFGTQYCAYHTTGTVTVNGAPHSVIYAAMPYNNSQPSACTAGTGAPNGDPGADYETTTLIHEIEESTTDYLGNAVLRFTEDGKRVAVLRDVTNPRRDVLDGRTAWVASPEAGFVSRVDY